jgi:methyl-accepting chemotaxis protein
MSKFFARITAAFLFFGAVVGLLLSLAMIVLVFPVKAKIAVAVGDTLDLTYNALTTTSDFLEVVDDTLGEVDSSFSLLVESTRSTADSLKGTSELTTSIAGLVGSGISKVIGETQESLEAASKTARVIDDALAIITAVPLFKARYEPENTLESSITGISTSLDPMESALGNIQDDLDRTAGDLGGIRTSLDDLADSLDNISASIDDAQTSADQYQETVDGLIEKVEYVQNNYRAWLTVAAILIIAFFLWMAAAQVGILMQARAMWTGKPLQFTSFNAKAKKPVQPAVESKLVEEKQVEDLPSEAEKEEIQS